ncbi:MAG: bifunctional molybdenum cofactor biosynthesis protein MoaC/MoaB [Legionellales bacterium]|nr:bifunctional molybdenum cofactor biosynthesis protein MoaC/MoaB [Legionellales bacterium]
MLTSQFHMIDVGKKTPTHRLAVATGRISVGKTAFELINERRLPKGDPLVLAEIAGIQGAKKTAELIPLCHPLPLEHIDILIDLDPEQHAIIITAFVSTTSKTGVEMEALSAVNAALLTVYDLTKMVESNLIISEVRLLLKQGGKQGLWLSPQGVPEWVLNKTKSTEKKRLSQITSGVITLSDRANGGHYEDRSGQWLCDALRSEGSELLAYDLLPDDKTLLQTRIIDIINQHHPHLILTTGGTGISPRDITPEALLGLSTQTVPGIGEYLRANGHLFTPLSWISRSMAVIIENTLVIALPGRLAAVQEGLPCLIPLIPHLVQQLQGGNHDPAS